MDAYDSSAGPVGQLRVCARLEREGAEERVVGTEGRLDVEATHGCLHPGPSDGDRRPVEQVVPAKELETPRGPAHDDAEGDRVDIDRGGGHPAKPTVRSHRKLDLKPGTAVGSTSTRESDDDL